MSLPYYQDWTKDTWDFVDEEHRRSRSRRKMGMKNWRKHDAKRMKKLKKKQTQ